MYISIFSTMLFIYTLNANGLRDPYKNAQILGKFCNKANSIIFLQETHFVEENDSETWSKKWQGKSIWTGKMAHSCRVAILFSHDLEITILNQTLDSGGRFILCKACINNHIFTLLNIYAPNSPKERPPFFKSLLNLLPQNPGNFILSGDFNMVEDIHRDRRGVTPTNQHLSGILELQKLTKTTDSMDVWTILTSGSPGYTWNSADFTISSRLDRLYVNSALLHSVQNIKIFETSLSDHKILSISIQQNKNNSRGTGYWKLNTNILDENTFIEELKSFWSYWSDQKQNYPLDIWWDKGKAQVKDLCLQFSQRSGKARKKRLSKLNSLIQVEESRTSPNPERINELRQEIEILTNPNYKGAQIRSKCKLDELFETPNAFFFKAEKSKQKKKDIDSLRIGRKTNSNPSEIRQAIQEFYAD